MSPESTEASGPPRSATTPTSNPDAASCGPEASRPKPELESTTANSGAASAEKTKGLIAWLSKEGMQFNLGPFARMQPKTALGFIVAIAVMLLFVVLNNLGYLAWISRTASSAGPSATGAAAHPVVAVLYPDPLRDTPEAGVMRDAYRDGRVQHEGFESARDLLGPGGERVKKVPYEMNGDHFGTIRSLYEQDGIRVFVMTMSSQIERVLPDYVSWREKLSSKPILICTVASAPGIGDAEHGVLRLYPRSEEECQEIAAHLYRRGATSHVGVFFISRGPGKPEPYGNAGRVSLHRSLNALGVTDISSFATSMDDAEENVRKFLSETQPSVTSGGAPSKLKASVVIIGYGRMIRECLEQLEKQGFEGDVCCTSTLTEPEWQPVSRASDSRVFCTLPRVLDRSRSLEPKERTTVFYFSREALLKAYDVGLVAGRPAEFQKRWALPALGPLRSIDAGVDVKYLYNGDSVIEMEVVGSEVWRAPRSPGR